MPKKSPIAEVEMFSDTSDSSHNTDNDDGLCSEELFWKYKAKSEKLLYKAKKEFLQSGERLQRIEALISGETSVPKKV